MARTIREPGPKCTLYVNGNTIDVRSASKYMGVTNATSDIAVGTIIKQISGPLADKWTAAADVLGIVTEVQTANGYPLKEGYIAAGGSGKVAYLPFDAGVTLGMDEDGVGSAGTLIRDSLDATTKYVTVVDSRLAGNDETFIPDGYTNSLQIDGSSITTTTTNTPFEILGLDAEPRNVVPSDDNASDANALRSKMRYLIRPVLTRITASP